MHYEPCIMNYILCIFLLCLLLLIVLWMHHQRKLKRRAYLMLEAIKNRDFSFRLPIRGMPSGEKALQETLNALGQEIARQTTRNEVENWRRMARVMTHEMMNSIAPIASISQSMTSRQDVLGTPLEPAIRTIYETSQHLTTIIQDFRQLTLHHEPHAQRVPLARIGRAVSALFPKLQWHIDIPEDLAVETDEGMLRQTLTNLTKNAQEAGARRMSLSWEDEALLVSNDGNPIPAELQREIFTPFFTTKRGGSGIGLALSRQLMVVQGGDLSLEIQPQRGFTVTFRIDWSH